MQIINILSQIQPIPDPAHRDNHIPLFVTKFFAQTLHRNGQRIVIDKISCHIPDSV